MSKTKDITTVNVYIEYVGAETLHPEVGVVHYDELQHCRHSLNNYGVYGLFMIQQSSYTIAYGQGQYRREGSSIMFVAPGQQAGVEDDGKEIEVKGWCLLIDPRYLAGSALEQLYEQYRFFSYYEAEALRLKPEAEEALSTLFGLIRKELRHGADCPHQREIVLGYIKIVLEYCVHYYHEQIEKEAKEQEDSLLKRFHDLLNRYYHDRLQQRYGLPKVKYCAQDKCRLLSKASAER